jgi:uncharacterized membrane protein
MDNLKKYFISGLIFIIPISLSVWILYKTVKFLDDLLGNTLRNYFPDLYTPGIGFFSLILLILLIGFFTQNFLGSKIVRGIENLLGKVPLFNKIYITIKGIIQNLMKKRATFFKEAVKIEFIGGSYTIGFLTGESTISKNKGFINVFVPTVPNISTGFYLIVPKKRVEKLEMSVEDAFRMVVSMGVYEPENVTDKI